jgi:hypothetical protein
MPLEITQCLRVPGADHLCDVSLAASWLSTLLGPMAKLATVVTDVVSCRLLDASARLATLVAARRGKGLPILPVTLASLSLFSSEM